MEMLRIYDVEDLGALPSGMWGIREPEQARSGSQGLRENALDVGLDLILMPGVAFDRSFSRLGYGKGYYDKFISTYKIKSHSRATHASPILLGLALEEHVLDAGTIPVGDMDWPVHGIVSPAIQDDILRALAVEENVTQS